MTSREQFEEWVVKETGFDLWRTEFPMTEWDDQQYKCHQTNLAWMAWQASRAAVDINLPAKNDISDEDRQIPDLSDWDDGRNSGIQECVEAIRTAGIKVKDC